MTTKTRKPTTDDAAPTRPERARPNPATGGTPRPDRRGRRAAPRPAAQFWQAWGPLLAVVVVALAAVVALAINPYVVQDRLPRQTPTPMTIPDNVGQVIPPAPPTPAAVQQTAIAIAQAEAAARPTATAPAAAAPGVRPTELPFLAPSAPGSGNVNDYPAQFAVPAGRPFPPLAFPDSTAGLASSPDAVALMNQSRGAISRLKTMRERLYGRYVDPTTGKTQGVEDYLYLYRAPDTRFRTGTYTLPFEGGLSQTQPIALDVGLDYYKPESDNRWSKAQNRSAYTWPSLGSVFGNAFNAAIVGEDSIDGRAFQVVEYDQRGSEEVGAPGFQYRNRVWIDSATSLPFKMEKNSFINRSVRGDAGGATSTVRQYFYQISLFDSFDEPANIPTPTNVFEPTPQPQATPTPR